MVRQVAFMNGHSSEIMNTAASAISSGEADAAAGMQFHRLRLCRNRVGKTVPVIDDLLRGDIARCQRVYAHALACILETERPGHAEQCVLGKGIRKGMRDNGEGMGGSDVEHRHRRRPQ